MRKEYVKITSKGPNLKYQLKLPLYEAGQAMTLIEANFGKAAIRPDIGYHAGYESARRKYGGYSDETTN